MANTPSASEIKIAFMYDDRLPHDRNSIFVRMAAQIKAKFPVDVIPLSTTEDELLAHLQAKPYTLVLLPWYKYIAWKKLDGFFGSLRMQGPTVAGYFADAVLPFEFSTAPNFHRTILLDFYRIEQSEIEVMIQALVFEDKRSGLSGFSSKNSSVYESEWRQEDHHSTRCIDAALKIPLLQTGSWTNRQAGLRFYLTGLWMLCAQENRSYPDTTVRAHLEIGELNKHLIVKLNFHSPGLTLKTMMEHLWPSGPRTNLAINEMLRNSDFLRVHHFPESQHLEITAFFSPDAPSLKYPGEVRGFWIEPLQKKYLRSSEENLIKRIPIQQETSLETQAKNLRHQLQEVEKRISEKRAEKKKIA